MANDGTVRIGAEIDEKEFNFCFLNRDCTVADVRFKVQKYVSPNLMAAVTPEYYTYTFKAAGGNVYVSSPIV